jgi:uncharacterized membrane protein YkvA (DUF1232 family)
MASTFQNIIKGPSRLLILLYSFSDERTGLTSKFFLLFACIYLISPIDLIPDFFPFAGWFDDLVVVPFLLNYSFKSLPPAVLAEAQRKTKMLKIKLWLFVLFSLFAFAALLFGLFKIIF